MPAALNTGGDEGMEEERRGGERVREEDGAGGPFFDKLSLTVQCRIERSRMAWRSR